MQSRKVLLTCLTSLAVLSTSGLALSHHHVGPPSPPTPPPTSTVNGPVQQMDYDVTTDILLGMPNGTPPLTSFQRDRFTVDLPADITTYPPDPCKGIAEVWNSVLGDPTLGFIEQRRVEGLVLQVMAANQCAAAVTRNVASTPPVILSFQPIGSL